jgi:uroporphyrinogen-III synthase
MSPLEGKTIITTQPADQAGELLHLLTARGATAINLPMIETLTLRVAGEELQKCLVDGKFQLIVFTSKKGVRGFFENLMRFHGSVSLPGKTKIAVTGPSTLSEVENYGHRVDYLNPGTCAEDLASWLSEKVVRPGDNVLLALGTRAPGLLAGALSSKARITRINVYETIDVKEVDQATASLIRERKADMCIFTSPSGFHNFLRFFGDHNDLELGAIGKTTATAIKEAGYQARIISPYPSPTVLAEAIEKYFLDK